MLIQYQGMYIFDLIHHHNISSPSIMLLSGK